MAFTTNEEICNLAIAHLGSDVTIGDLDTDQSAEGKACRSFFEISRDTVLTDFQWPFARKVTDLTLVEENPTMEWMYSYRYPSDCVVINRIITGIVPETQDSRASYQLSSDASGLLIYTNQGPLAQLEYTSRQENVAYYPPAFITALSLRLAVFISPRIAGANKLGDRAFQLYRLELSQAKANALNEEQQSQPADSEFIRARG